MPFEGLQDGLMVQLLLYKCEDPVPRTPMEKVPCDGERLQSWHRSGRERLVLEFTSQPSSETASAKCCRRPCLKNKGELAQWVTALATRSGDSGLIPGVCIVEGEKGPHNMSSGPHVCQALTCLHPHKHTIHNKQM